MRRDRGEELVKRLSEIVRWSMSSSFSTCEEKEKREKRFVSGKPSLSLRSITPTLSYDYIYSIPFAGSNSIFRTTSHNHNESSLSFSLFLLHFPVPLHPVFELRREREPYGVRSDRNGVGEERRGEGVGFKGGKFGRFESPK